MCTHSAAVGAGNYTSETAIKGDVVAKEDSLSL